jgi:hypothetical protein
MEWEVGAISISISIVGRTLTQAAEPLPLAITLRGRNRKEAMPIEIELRQIEKARGESEFFRGETDAHTETRVAAQEAMSRELSEIGGDLDQADELLDQTSKRTDTYVAPNGIELNPSEQLTRAAGVRLGAEIKNFTKAQTNFAEKTAIAKDAETTATANEVVASLEGADLVKPRELSEVTENGGDVGRMLRGKFSGKEKFEFQGADDKLQAQIRKISQVQADIVESLNTDTKLIARLEKLAATHPEAKVREEAGRGRRALRALRNLGAAAFGSYGLMLWGEEMARTLTTCRVTHAAFGEKALECFPSDTVPSEDDLTAMKKSCACELCPTHGKSGGPCKCANLNVDRDLEKGGNESCFFFNRQCSIPDDGSSFKGIQWGPDWTCDKGYIYTYHRPTGFDGLKDITRALYHDATQGLTAGFSFFNWLQAHKPLLTFLGSVVVVMWVFGWSKYLMQY